MSSEFQSIPQESHNFVELTSIEPQSLVNRAGSLESAFTTLASPKVKTVSVPEGASCTLPDGATVVQNSNGAIIYCKYASGCTLKRFADMVILARPGNDCMVNIANKSWMHWD